MPKLSLTNNEAATDERAESSPAPYSPLPPPGHQILAMNRQAAGQSLVQGMESLNLEGQHLHQPQGLSLNQGATGKPPVRDMAHLTLREQQAHQPQRRNSAPDATKIPMATAQDVKRVRATFEKKAIRLGRKYTQNDIDDMLERWRNHKKQKKGRRNIETMFAEAARVEGERRRRRKRAWRCACKRRDF
ncbi:hypothetical protein F53441_13657 [Fusarium austroafricanum]|uniref:Uncharacterized protein n=1 Tax=Fusarium austroafricanum TaxID=2364996 RepID=A0A8H4NGZ6_9HYPO|nr:hypothetical protein F53441_13657 [Fusarium austroafricanum]